MVKFSKRIHSELSELSAERLEFLVDQMQERLPDGKLSISVEQDGVTEDIDLEEVPKVFEKAFKKSRKVDVIRLDLTESGGPARRIRSILSEVRSQEIAVYIYGRSEDKANVLVDWGDGSVRHMQDALAGTANISIKDGQLYLSRGEVFSYASQSPRKSFLDRNRTVALWTIIGGAASVVGIVVAVIIAIVKD